MRSRKRQGRNRRGAGRTRARRGATPGDRAASARNAEGSTLAERVMQLSVVILAAGQGTRMNSDLPKVLLPLAGRPLLQHVLDTAAALEPAAHLRRLRLRRRPGAGGRRRPTAPSTGSCRRSSSAPGHAVMQAMPLIPDDHLVLVLYGDVPLMRLDTLRQLIAAADGEGLALLTVDLAESGRLRPHRARRRRPGARHRRAPGCRLRSSSRSASSTPA